MREQRARAELDVDRARRVVLFCALAAGIAVAVSACGSEAGESRPPASERAPAAPSPGPANSPVPSVPPAQSDPAATPDSSAADAITSAIEDSLNSLAAETPRPASEELKAAFQSAGADAGSVEVSVDTTPTGLEVDAMTAAVPVGDICIFGHVRDGIAAVTQLPVLADGQCFVGDQR